MDSEKIAMIVITIYMVSAFAMVFYQYEPLTLCEEEGFDSEITIGGIKQCANQNNGKIETGPKIWCDSDLFWNMFEIFTFQKLSIECYLIQEARE